MKLSKEQLIVGLGYIVFMLAFLFIGMPRLGFIEVVVAFAILTALYYFFVVAVKKIMKKG